MINSFIDEKINVCKNLLNSCNSINTIWDNIKKNIDSNNAIIDEKIKNVKNYVIDKNDADKILKDLTLEINKYDRLILLVKSDIDYYDNVINSKKEIYNIDDNIIKLYKDNLILANKIKEKNKNIEKLKIWNKNLQNCFTEKKATYDRYIKCRQDFMKKSTGVLTPYNFNYAIHPLPKYLNNTLL